MAYPILIVEDLLESLNNADFTVNDLKKLTISKNLQDIKDVLNDKAEILKMDLVDLDADPFIPPGWSLKEHKRGGLLKYNSKKIIPFLTKGQKENTCVFGYNLKTELKDESIILLNANLLDYLLLHPELIPEEFKKYFLFFWGTIYRNEVNKPCIRHLAWSAGEWYGDYMLLSSNYYNASPAAVLLR